MASVAEDGYEIPLRDQRFFGAGIKRKRIQFVPSTAEATSPTTSLPRTSSTSVADRYLSIVLKKQKAERPSSVPPPAEQDLTLGAYSKRLARQADAGVADNTAEENSALTARCNICKLPLCTADATRHESSIAHQICLEHTQPPSHIDRTRKGLAVLENRGWDPDSRLGLGATGGEGRLYPVRATENPNRAGLGVRFDKVKAVEKPAKLDAGKARLVEKEGKKKAERLRNAFYRSDEVERYLGQEQVNDGLDLEAFRRAKRRGG